MHRSLLFSALFLLLLLACNKDNPINIGKIALVTVDAYGLQSESTDSSFQYPDIIALYMVHVAGLKKDKENKVYPEMDVIVEDEIGHIYFEKLNYIGKPEGIELEDDDIPYLFILWHILPDYPSGNYKFVVRLFDTKNDHEINIEKAFSIK